MQNHAQILVGGNSEAAYKSEELLPKNLPTVLHVASVVSMTSFVPQIPTDFRRSAGFSGLKRHVCALLVNTAW